MKLYSQLRFITAKDTVQGLRNRYPSVKRSCTGSKIIALSLQASQEVSVNLRDTCLKEVCLNLRFYSSQRAGHIGSMQLLCDQPWCKTCVRHQMHIRNLHIYFKCAVILIYLGPWLQAYRVTSLSTNYENVQGFCYQSSIKYYCRGYRDK